MKYVVVISEIVLRALGFCRDQPGLEAISPPAPANVFLKLGEGHRPPAS